MHGVEAGAPALCPAGVDKQMQLLTPRSLSLPVSQEEVTRSLVRRK